MPVGAERAFVFGALGTLVPLAGPAAIAVGSVPLPFVSVLGALASSLGLELGPEPLSPAGHAILLTIRLPRVLLAAVVGGGMLGHASPRGAPGEPEASPTQADKPAAGRMEMPIGSLNSGAFFARVEAMEDSLEHCSRADAARDVGYGDAPRSARTGSTRAARRAGYALSSHGESLKTWSFSPMWYPWSPICSSTKAEVARWAWR